MTEQRDNPLTGDPEMVRWLASEIAGWAAYVNHKEVMAWVATAFFVTTCGILIASPALKAGAHELLASVVIGSAVVLMFYVRVQLQKRWTAVALLYALRLTLLQLLNPSVTTPSAQSVGDGPTLQCFPHLVAENYERAQAQRKKYLESASTLGRLRDNQIRTQVVAVALIVGLAGGTAWVLWWERPATSQAIEDRLAAHETRLKALGGR